MSSARDCIFCAIASGDAPAQVVVADASTMTFMDINPATRGHLLVVPRRHAATIWDLNDEESAAVMASVVKAAHALRDALEPDGLNVVQANGAIAFQTVFHIHFHLVPRYVGDDIRLPWIPTPGDPDEIAEAADSIRGALTGGSEPE